MPSSHTLQAHTKKIYIYRYIYNITTTKIETLSLDLPPITHFPPFLSFSIFYFYFLQKIWKWINKSFQFQFQFKFQNLSVNRTVFPPVTKPTKSMPILQLPSSSSSSFFSSFPAISKPQSPPFFLLRSAAPRSFSGRCVAHRLGDDDVDDFTQKSGYLFELSSSDADSLADYDVSKIAAIYRRKPLLVVRRLFQIGTTFGKWFALRYVDSLMERSDQMFEVSLIFFSKIKMF